MREMRNGYYLVKDLKLNRYEIGSWDNAHGWMFAGDADVWNDGRGGWERFAAVKYICDIECTELVIAAGA